MYLGNFYEGLYMYPMKLDQANPLHQMDNACCSYIHDMENKLA